MQNPFDSSGSRFGSRAISRRKSGSGAGCLGLFFALFLLAGLGFLYFLGRPILQTIGARSWNEVPCTILESSVQSHSGDGTTYSVAVRYEYEVEGRLYRSDRYRFLGGSSSGYDSKAEVVAGLPVGGRTVCYVDPKDPGQAVLNRSFGAWVLLALLPLGFVAIGLGGLVWSLREALRGSRTGPAPDPQAVAASSQVVSAIGSSATWLPQPSGTPRSAIASVDGGLDLKPAAGPVAKLVGITFVALFWNGIVSVFLNSVVAGWRNGHGDGCLTLFLVPFVVIGIGLLIAIPYQILALFNPRPHLFLDRSRLRPGEAARLSWSFSGSAGRIKRLKITLEGREEASYRRGTTTHTDRSTFATLVLLESDQSAAFASGEIEVLIPSGSMHSFSASNNKILWNLMVAGDIARWPDVSEEFDLVVLPETPRRNG